MAKLHNNAPRRRVLRAAHPNVGVTHWFDDQLAMLLQDAVRDAVIEVGHAYAQAPPTVGITMDAPSSTKRIDAALKRWGKKWLKKFDKLSVDLSQRFAKRAFSATDVSLQAALRDAGFTVKFQPTTKMLESYRLVVSENVGLIRNLQASLYNKIQQDTWASVRAGSDMGTLATKLQHSYGIERKRAALIARDQNAKAKAVLETTRRQELGISKAIWQHSSAGREPRPTHVAMNGKEFELSKGMYDEDEGKYVFPGELINCRCTSRAIIPGIDE